MGVQDDCQLKYRQSPIATVIRREVGCLMWFGTYLYKNGVITGDEFAEAVCNQLARRPMIGQLALKHRAMTVREVMRVLEYQAEHPGTSFGEIALERGYITAQELASLLLHQDLATTPFHEILVEMGVLDFAQSLRELEKARASTGNYSSKPPKFECVS